MASIGQFVNVKYDLYLDVAPQRERAGKVDRVEVLLEPDPEDVAIALRDAIHQRRRARDLAHCSAANLRVFPTSAPDVELSDDDLFRFLLEGAPERLLVLAPGTSAGRVSLPSYIPSPGSKHQSQQQQPQQAHSGPPDAPASHHVRRSSSASSPATTPGGRRDSFSAKREGDTMVVFVKTGDQTLPIEVDASGSVDGLKAKLYEQERIPVEQQRLVYAGNEMLNGRSLAHYHVHQGSEIQVVLTLPSST